MTTLPERDQIINRLRDQILANNAFLGGVKLTPEEQIRLGGLKYYLEGIGNVGGNDLARVNALLAQK
jgi:hypothetical protein